MQNSPTVVLIIDDNPKLLRIFVESLAALGSYNVVTATDGVEGLKRYYESHPRCVVVDVMMPHLDGYQFVRALRGDPASTQVPVIMLTALAQDKDRFTGLAAGADRYLVKPVKPTELVVAIQEAIATSSDERNHRMQRLAESTHSA